MSDGWLEVCLLSIHHETHPLLLCTLGQFISSFHHVVQFLFIWCCEVVALGLGMRGREEEGEGRKRGRGEEGKGKKEGEGRRGEREEEGKGEREEEEQGRKERGEKRKGRKGEIGRWKKRARGGGGRRERG